MNGKYTREIDLMDLLLNWLDHWKSLFLCIIVGVIFACGYMYIGRTTSEPSTAKEEKLALEQLAKGTTLSTLSANQLAGLTVKDMEKYFLSEKDIQAVDAVIELNNQYNENIDIYNSQKDALELVDRAEAFNYISNTKNLLETRKGALTADQQIYYYAKLGVSTVVGNDSYAVVENNDDSAASSVVVTNTASRKKAILIVILAFILHFALVACRYIFDNKIKHTDKLTAIVDVPEYTRMVDWDAIDQKKGLDKFVANIRYAKMRRTALDEVVEINSCATIEKLKNKNYNSIAVVGTAIETEREMLVKQISKDWESLVVKSIDSITHSVNGADDVSGVDSAIMAVRVGVTRFDDFIEELQSLRDRDVDVIGIAIFE